MPQYAGEVGEQPVVIHDPMERGGGQDGVDGRDRDRIEQIVHQELHAIVGEARTSLFDHGRRAVERDDGSLRQPPEQLARHLTGPTTRVEDALVTGQVKPSHHLGAPARHGDRESVVGVGVPVPGHRPARLPRHPGVFRVGRS